jgi:monoterpene epsilon-lactone hydrolase
MGLALGAAGLLLLGVGPVIAGSRSGDPEASASAKMQRLKDWLATDAATQRALLPALRDKLGVISRPTTIAGVAAYVVEPKTIPAAHKDIVVLSFHGGGFLQYPGEAGTREAIFMAGLGGYRVVAVDYRMPPDHPYPAAMDDAITVYKAILATTAPRRIALIGTSAGGGIVLSLCLRAKAEGLPLPAVIALGMPFAAMTEPSLYAGAHDRSDPQLSPLNGDFSGLPPAILTSGTKDFLLAMTRDVDDKLRKAGVESRLQVFEGMGHAGYLGDPDSAQNRDAFKAITAFFDAHLAP